MKWIKASERLPNEYVKLWLRIDGSESRYSGHYEIKSNSFYVPETIGEFFSPNRVEWLDETETDEVAALKAANGKYSLEDMYMLAAKVVNDIAANRMNGDWNLRTTPKMIADDFIENGFRDYKCAASRTEPGEHAERDINGMFKWAKENEWYFDGENFVENTGHDNFETLTPNEFYNLFLTRKQ